jgi:hypothetical protein
MLFRGSICVFEESPERTYNNGFCRAMDKCLVIVSVAPRLDGFVVFCVRRPDGFTVFSVPPGRLYSWLRSYGATDQQLLVPNLALLACTCRPLAQTGTFAPD